MEPVNIYVAIPAMDELEGLPLTLHDLQQNKDVPFQIYICVNQPEIYWQQNEKVHFCHHNQQLLDWLLQQNDSRIHVLDYASPGNGWTGKKLGVGWARKVLFDHILSIADDRDLIISTDADTRIRPNYIESIARNFAKHPKLTAISVPYYHPLTQCEANDRAILRYELYMRNWVINLYHIGSPYNFTAVGSAIAMRAGALRKIGGITPLKSGEDFYLLQKFRKMSPISNYNEVMVYPAARFSDRVFFGTGPALIKGSQGNWDSYPIYRHELFNTVADAYQQLPILWKKDIDNEFLTFLKIQFKDDNLWQTIRQNVKDLPHFEHAFHEKADGLRLLQFIRHEQLANPDTSERALYLNLMQWMPKQMPQWFHSDSRFDNLSVNQMDELRNLLFNYEMDLRKNS